MTRGFLFKASPSQITLISSVILILANVVFALTIGPKISPDSRYYSQQADILVESNFRFDEFLSKSDATKLPVFRLVFVTVVAGLKILFGENWPWGLIFLNLLFSSLAIVVLLTNVSRFSKSRLTLFIVFVLLFLAQDFRLWIPYALTDTIYASLSFLVIVLFASRMERFNNLFSLKNIDLIFLTLITIFIRPAFPPLIAVILLFLLWETLKRMVNLKEHIVNRRFIAFIFVSGLMAICVFAFVIFYISQYIDRENWGLFRRVLRLYEQGWVVKERPDLAVVPPVNYVDYLALIFLRIPYFLVFWHKDFSALHNLVNLVFYIPTYILTMIGGFRIFQSRTWIDSRISRLIEISLLFIILTTLFHSSINIDFDWRYRNPILFPIVFLAAVGVEHMVRNAYLRQLCERLFGSFILHPG